DQYEDLRRTEAGLRSLIEHSPEGILVARDGVIVYANPALVQFLNYADVADLVGRPVAMICVELALPSPETNGAGSSTRPLAFVDKEGETRPTEATTFSAYFDGQRANVSMIRDVAIKNRMLSQAMEMDRLIAMGTVAAGVAHEINNPLSYVLTNLAFLQDVVAQEEPESGSSEDLQEALASTIEGVEQIGTIVRDLKDFSRERRDAKRAVDVRDVISRAVKMAQHEMKIRAGLDLELNLELDLEEPLWCDPHRLSQVILNLLLNAIQSMEEGAVEENRLTITSRREDDRGLIEIVDTGRGIAAVDLPHIFEPFYTTRSKTDGTGMGLFISRTIIERHGGTLTLESVEGEGATVSISLPLGLV
ncbi:MAG: ATP-binding protein, partial [Bradymonadaceae bacterium]